MKPISIQLNKEVVVGDPSKKLKDTLQIKNVKPGTFYVFHKIYNCGEKGKQIGKLLVVHEHHLNDNLHWVKRETYVKIKSGIAGIFSEDTYRQDSIFPKKSSVTLDLSVDVLPEGNDWYGHIIEKTLNETKHGEYFKGCMCNTPATDKTYDVHIARKCKRPIAFMIDFDLDNTRYVKYDWWVEEKPVTAL